MSMDTERKVDEFFVGIRGGTAIDILRAAGGEKIELKAPLAWIARISLCLQKEKCLTVQYGELKYTDKMRKHMRFGKTEYGTLMALFDMFEPELYKTDIRLREYRKAYSEEKGVAIEPEDRVVVIPNLGGIGWTDMIFTDPNEETLFRCWLPSAA